MSIDLLFQKKEPIDTELLNSFFNKIQERMPKFIISHHKDEVEFLLSHIDKSVQALKKELVYVNSDEFQEKFKSSLNNLIEYLNTSIEGTALLHELTPAWHELVDIKINHKNIFNDLIEQKNKREKINLPSEIFLNSSQVDFIGVDSQEWEGRAKKELKKIFTDFDLRSVQVAQQSSWKEIYKWAKITYSAIKESQEKIGMDMVHVGVRGCLNLSFNPGSCKQSRGNGKMFADEHCNTMVLTSFPKHIQSVIFQHEYAHVLDNRVGVNLARSQLPANQVHSCIFLSQIEMERQLTLSPYKFSQDEKLCEAQIWMSEAISDAVCGSSSDSLKAYQQKCSEAFSRNLAENFIIKCIGEKNWLKLYDNNKDLLLENKEIIKYVDSLAEQIYKNGVRNLFTSYWENKENYNFFKDAIKEIKVVAGTQMCENAYVSFKENLPALSWDYLGLMKKYYYSHTNAQRYFSKSKTAIAASQHSLKWVSPYHTRTLEVFARSCEDLQRPLIVSTNEYFIEKEKKVIDTESFLNPTLNKNERKVFISTIHSLARSLGMQVKSEIDKLPALKELVIDYPHTTYSSMSENEDVAFVMLDKVNSRLKVSN